MLPSQLKYNNKINASYARNFNSVIAPQNTSNFFLTQTAIINIPTGANMFMSGPDSLLSFEINIRNTTGAAAAAASAFGKAGASGAIRRLRIFHGSTLLNDDDSYGNNVAMLYAMQRSREDLAGKGAILEATGGGDTGAVIGAVNAAATYTVKCCIPLHCILSQCDNYVPLWALTGAPIRLEIQWESAIAKFIGSDIVFVEGTAGTFQNVKFIANMIEVSDAGMEIIKRSLNGGPVEWVTQAYSNFQSSNSLANGVSTTLSIPIPAKYHSLKALFATFRDKSAGAANHFADASGNFGMTSYTTRIGSSVIPSIAPDTIPQYLAELERALGCVSNRHSVSSYSPTQYRAAASVDLTYSPAFAVGIELESYSNLSDMSSTYTGMNTTTSDIFFTPTFTAGAAYDIIVDVYALYDQLIVIENGMCTVQV